LIFYSQALVSFKKYMPPPVRKRREKLEYNKIFGTKHSYRWNNSKIQ
jgi:hypothetical protein